MFERFKQLDRQTVIMLILAGVVGILLFSAIAGGIRQAGWNDGFLFGLLAGGGENAKAVTPYLGYRGGYLHHGWGWHPFGFIGGFFRFLFFGFLLVMFFKFLGFWRWRMHGGHHWHHHHDQHQGQPQPEQGSQPSPNPTQPDVNTPQPTSWVNV